MIHWYFRPLMLRIPIFHQRRLPSALSGPVVYESRTPNVIYTIEHRQPP